MAMPLARTDFDSPLNGHDANGARALALIQPETKAGVRILLADEESAQREGCESLLREEGYDLVSCGHAREALQLVQRRPFDIVLVDCGMREAEGLMLLQTARAANPDAQGIVMTRHPSVEGCVEALSKGASEYLLKPFSATQLQIALGRAVHTVLEARRERGGQEGGEWEGGEGEDGRGEKIVFLGRSPAFRRAISLARKVAPTDASVLITGESGSGKELVAQFIHRHSRRAARPFVAINCAALPEALLESELFGHRKGAFTGAVRDKPGLLEAADGGTLFLDELLEMPKPVQAKFLRVLQDGVVRRVGSETTDAVVNVRFLAATNGDLDAALATRELREDLYYRLRVVPIHLPPLRERRDDIPLLTAHFLDACWARHRPKGAPRPTLTPEAIQALSSHPWSGNVRELQNVIERVAVIVEPGAAIRAEDLDLPSGGTFPVGPPDASPGPADGYHVARDQAISYFEREYLTDLVSRAAGNMTRAARAAGVDRTTLYRMMERHGLARGARGRGLVAREAPPLPHAPVLLP